MLQSLIFCFAWSAVFPDFFHVASFSTAFLHYIGGRAIFVESTKKTVGFFFIRQHRPYTNDQNVTRYNRGTG